MRPACPSCHKRSMRAYQSASINRDAKGNTIQSQRNAVTVIKFQIKVFGLGGLVLRAGIEAIVLKD